MYLKSKRYSNLSRQPNLTVSFYDFLSYAVSMGIPDPSRIQCLFKLSFSSHIENPFGVIQPSQTS